MTLGARLDVDNIGSAALSLAIGARPMSMTNEVAKLIERIVRDELADVTIEAVKVVEALDFQDERVFKIMVIFDQKEGLDPKKTSGIARHIRNKLMETNDNSPFPVLSFVSKADAASIKPEAA